MRILIIFTEEIIYGELNFFVKCKQACQIKQICLDIRKINGSVNKLKGGFSLKIPVFTSLFV